MQLLIFFSHVPQLEDEAAEDAAERGQEIRRGEAEDEAGELAVTEPGTTRDHAETANNISCNISLCTGFS